VTAILTVVPTDTVDQVLDRAARYVARHGWLPSGLYEVHRNCPLKCRVHRTGGYPASILGAIRVAVFGQPRWYLDTATDIDRHLYTAAVEWFNTYLLAVGHAGQHGTVFDWQTTEGRDLGDVYTALRAAATAYTRHTGRSAA
jgi:hypothetical protein